MASLECDEFSGRYRIRFRYGGQPYKRSLKTTDVKETQGILGRLEETIRLLERGRIEIPPDAEPGVFILADGKLHTKPSAERQYTVKALLKLYLESVTKASKADTTLKTEETHISHLLRHLRNSKLAQSVTNADMQAYVEERLRDCYRKKPIRPETVKKEVATFRLIWNWGVAHGYLTGPAPTKVPKGQNIASVISCGKTRQILTTKESIFSRSRKTIPLNML